MGSLGSQRETAQGCRTTLATSDYIPQHEGAKADKVDQVTDLFGQVPPDSKYDAPIFAGRIRPENLVFHNAASSLTKNVVLAPLSVPHPGCSAFYRDTNDPTDDALAKDVRGYKVYRTTLEEGRMAV